MLKIKLLKFIKRFSFKKNEIILLFSSILITIFMLEVILRISILTPYLNIRLLRNPILYADPMDNDYWYFRYVFGRNQKYKINIKNKKKISNRFYDNWGLSLEPDQMLGYVRKKNVKIPCHETSNFGTRGLRDYTLEGEKIIFYGNSYVESNACSKNTITSKIERKTGIDVLNYGVGGYGFDQIYLLFKRTFSQFEGANSIYFIGVLSDDFNRMLLKVRTSPKPYFTLSNNKLILHTEHINKDDLESYYIKYRPKFNLYFVMLLNRSISKLIGWDENNKKENRKEIALITSHILEEIRSIKEENNLTIYFILFYSKKEIENDVDAFQFFKIQLKEKHLEYLDLKDCLLINLKKNITLTEIYHGHPSSLGNEIFSECIINNMNFWE